MRISFPSKLLLFTALLLSATTTFAQRLDVDMEGPWIFYLERNFTTQGGTATVLVAVAPYVPGHYTPIFSTGDGFQIELGTYCVAFDDACKPNNLTQLNPDNYAPPQPVRLTMPNSFDWTTLNLSSSSRSAYVLILPVPDSFSSDGLQSVTILSTLPTASNPGIQNQNESGPHSIGIMLHYNNGPATLNLFQCNGTPSVQNCKSTMVGNPQGNSGTLRIHMKSVEDNDPNDCEYHTKRAYHKMLDLVDHTLASNAQRAFFGDVKWNPACSPCDPQLGNNNSDCTASSTSLIMVPAPAILNAPTSAPAIVDVPKALSALVDFIKKNLAQQGDSTSLNLGELEPQANKLSGKFPTYSQLHTLRQSVETSEGEIASLLGDTKDPNRAVALEVAASQEQALSQMIGSISDRITSGKDCRAAVMQVQ